jgi:hypothetical protein
MGYLHTVSLWYNYIFSLANNPSFTLLPMQHSYATNIANSRKEHNIVGPKYNSHYLNKELEVGRTNTLYGWLSVYRGRSECARKIVPPSVFDPRTIQLPEGHHTGYVTPAAILTYILKSFIVFVPTKLQIPIIQHSLLSNLWPIRAADSAEHLYRHF